MAEFEETCGLELLITITTYLTISTALQGKIALLGSHRCKYSRNTLPLILYYIYHLPSYRGIDIPRVLRHPSPQDVGNLSPKAQIRGRRKDSTSRLQESDGIEAYASGGLGSLDRIESGDLSGASDLSYSPFRHNIRYKRLVFSDATRLELAALREPDWCSLTWCNVRIRTLGPEAYAMTWEVKGNDVPAYTERFQELDPKVPSLVANETEKVDKYTKGNGTAPKAMVVLMVWRTRALQEDGPNQKNNMMRMKIGMPKC
ncbi:hypothetical protein Tco_1509907 [Tanacetum coccineum]